jgi:phosphatidate cytidylyltransferase
LYGEGYGQKTTKNKGCDIQSIIIIGIIGLLSAIVSQFGDLSASLIKRHYGIKDYGKLFPGHGGVLDRFDSIFAVSVLLYLITELPLEVI